MGQEPPLGSRTQDRHNNVDKENTERAKIHSGMGRRLGRNPEPPPRIPREGNSSHEPPRYQLTEGKLKLVPTRRTLHPDREHVEHAGQALCELTSRNPF